MCACLGCGAGPRYWGACSDESGTNTRRNLPLLLFNFSNLDIGRCSDDEEPIEEEIYLCYFSQFLQFRLLLFLLQPLTICRTIHVSEGRRGWRESILDFENKICWIGFDKYLQLLTLWASSHCWRPVASCQWGPSWPRGWLLPRSKKTKHESSPFCHFANAQPEHQWHGGGSQNHPFLPSALDWGGGAGVQVRGGRWEEETCKEEISLHTSEYLWTETCCHLHTFYDYLPFCSALQGKSSGRPSKDFTLSTA